MIDREQILFRISELQIMRWRLRGNSEAVKQINEWIAEHLGDLEGK